MRLKILKVTFSLDAVRGGRHAGEKKFPVTAAFDLKADFGDSLTCKKFNLFSTLTRTEKTPEKSQTSSWPEACRLETHHNSEGHFYHFKINLVCIFTKTMRSNFRTTCLEIVQLEPIENIPC